MKPILLLLLFFLFLSNISLSQCVLPAEDADTITPVINRMSTPNPFGGTYALSDIDKRRMVGVSAVVGNTMYIGGNFTYLGPNTGTGVVMSTDGSQLFSPKKWRVNGPVFASVADGAGGFYIGGEFTKVGDSLRTNLAHINSQGVPDAWYPQVNNMVKAMAIKNDTLFIGGQFTTVNGQGRNAFAILDAPSGNLLPYIPANNVLQPGTVINTFKLVDSILYVGGVMNIYNLVGSVFTINTNSGSASNLPSTYHMQEVYTIDASDDRQKVFIGGWAGGGTATSNGFCINRANALLYRIDVGVQSISGRGQIYGLKVYGSNVYVGGLFNYGTINGNGFSQKGLVVFDVNTGAKRNWLNDCNGLVSSVHANNGKVYIGGEFSQLAGAYTNFVIYDTALYTGVGNTLSVSDKTKTISFSGNTMFTGGYMQSVGGMPRNNFAAFDLVTGAIKPWTLNVIVSALNDMESKGDTIFIAGNFTQPSPLKYLGGFLAVDANTATVYTSAYSFQTPAIDILIDTNYLYIGGAKALAKVTLPALTRVSSWNPSIGYDIKSVQKRNGKIYGIGDAHNYNSNIGYITVIDDVSGSIIRTATLNSSATLDWITGGVLVGSKLFFSGLFSNVLNVPRQNFAVFDVDSWSLTPIDVKVQGGFPYGKLTAFAGNVYLYGSYESVNNQTHRYFAAIDTSVGAVYPDRLHLNNDEPLGYHLDDFENYERLNTIQFVNNAVVLGGNFRNANKNMFPSLAKFPLTTGNQAPAVPQGITGPDPIQCPSTNNTYAVVNSQAGYAYVWSYSGNDATIAVNGESTIKLTLGAKGNPGTLKVVAKSECGASDTVRFTVHLNTTEPLTNASNVRMVRRTNTTATIKFTPGNGAQRLVILKSSQPIANWPQDGVDYIANSTYGAGSDVGGGTYVVYRGSGDSVDLIQLPSATLYYVSVVEFNGSGSGTNFLTTNNPVIAFKTLAIEPWVAASAIGFSNKTTNSITINCTPGNGQNRLVVVRKGPTAPVQPVDGIAYAANTQFGNGDNTGSLSFVVGTNTPVTLTGLAESQAYTVSIFEYNGTDSSTNYLLTGAPSALFITRANEPTIQASNIVVTNITGNGATISAMPGNGIGRLVVLREDNPVVDTPVDLTNYPNYTNIGHNSYVYGNFTPYPVFNLRSGVTYYVKLFEYNGGDTLSNYLIANAPSASFTTLVVTPTSAGSYLYASAVTATTANLSCNTGNGVNRIIVVRKDYPITDVPLDGQDYTASASFGVGSSIGNITYVVSKSPFVSLTNLQPGATYYAKEFEYNGTGTATRYLLTNAPTANFTTGSLTAEPTTQASNIVVNNISDNSATITCTAGNGGDRIIVIGSGTTITTQPVDGTAYTANPVFGSGSNLGNQTYVVAASSTSVTVTGLSGDADYAVSVFEFNGNGGNTNYLSTGNTSVSFRTKIAKPTIAASNIVVSAITENSATVSCTAGNGANRLIVVKAGIAITAQAVNGTAYIASTNFGNGSDLGGQTYVVSNTGNTVALSGLQPNTDYAIAVYEFNGTGTGAVYLTAGFPATTFKTSTVTGLVDLGVASTSLIIAPNPVADNTLNLTVTTGTTGKLNMKIMTMSGAVIYNQPLRIIPGTNNHTILLPASMSAGSFLVNFQLNGKTKSIVLFKK